MPYLDPADALNRRSIRVVVEPLAVLTGSVEIYLGQDPPMAATPGDHVYAIERVVHGINAGPAGVRFMAGLGPNEDAPDEQVEVPQPTNPA